MKQILCLFYALLLGGSVASPALAFCGFYVAGADAQLFNNATLVVLMRDGNRTVLSMQNNYQGPAESFAMVVPVPVVLQEENVKTLDPAIFTRVDRLSAPRLVEYWELDPCFVPPPEEPASDSASLPSSVPPKGEAVKVEAKFQVGEYDVVVLSADDSGALDTWLRANAYTIPEGAEPLLRPYVEEGMKFFVAKVDIAKVKLKDGMAMLSPLRFHYDDDKFRLPVRLGLVNSKGTQDLIVHILASSRYDVANYENVTIPTNLDLDVSAKDRFGAFYATLFDRTLETHDKAVVTEYAWSASGCDPCPTPPLTQAELATLGADVCGGITEHGAVLTRLHARYDKSSLGEDLVFRTAEPIVGGREVRTGDTLERGAIKSSYNAFQGRYAIRHPWRGRIACSDGRRGRWGGPPDARHRAPDAKPALELAFAPRGVELAELVRQDVPELGLTAKKTGRKPTEAPASLPPPSPAAPGAAPSSCGCSWSATEPALPVALFGLGLAALAVRVSRRGSRRRRRAVGSRATQPTVA